MRKFLWAHILVFLLIYLGICLPLLLLVLWMQENVYPYTLHFLAWYLITSSVARAAKHLTKETMK